MNTDKNRHEFHQFSPIDWDRNLAGFEFVLICEIRAKIFFPICVHPCPSVVKKSHD